MEDNKKVFSHLDIRDISLWEKFLLFFRKGRVYADGDYRIMCKEMYGKHYIIKNWYIKEDK